MTVQMLQIVPEIGRVVEWAALRGLPSRGDMGYVWHSALRAAFGSLAPQPFHVEMPRRPDGRPVILGYGSASAADLIAHRAAFTEPLLANAFPESGLAGKAMPQSWREGQRLRFTVRVCPVIRQDRGARDKARETDAFLAARGGAEDNGTVSREAVYRDWLADAFARAGGATMVQASLIAFQRTRIDRRDARRQPRDHEKPDATLQGELKVTDPAAFCALLARGIGRHRAFGFGMLLLKPGGASC